MEKEKLWTKDFALIIVINFLVFMDHIMVLNTFPMFLKEILGLNEGIAGLCAIFFSLVAVILRPFVGYLLNNGKRKSILIIGLIGMCLMTLGYAMSTYMAAIGYSMLCAIALAIVCRMLHGAALAFTNTSAATIASDSLPPSRFAEGMGYFGMATALATSIAPALSLALKEVSFLLMFIVAAGFMLLSLILFSCMKTHAMPVKEKQPLTLKGLIEMDALPASTICLVFLLTWGALENFLSSYAQAYQLPSGGIFFLITAFMLLFVRMVLGRMADEKGEGIFVYTCNAAMLVAFLLLALVPSDVTFYLAAVLAGYAFGGIEPALQSMAVHTAPIERRGSANSTFLCSYDIGLGLGGGLAGILIEAVGYRNMFLIICLATVASVLLYAFWGSKHPSSLKYKEK